MAEHPFAITVTYRAGVDFESARAATAGLFPFLQPWRGRINAVPNEPGVVAITVELGAEDSLTAANGGVGLINGAYAQTGTARPAPLVPVSVEARPA
jgi:hypothetical protein